MRLVDSRTCAPLGNVALDIWHCDALGIYSGFTANSPNGGRGGPGSGREQRQVDETRFLRGVQVSNDSGLVEFATVYPGWYSGRAIHIHMKVHTKVQNGGHVAHTGQVFFPEDLTERIARLEPYARRLEVHRTTQAEDNVFSSQHGAEQMASIEKLGKTDAEGFRATVTVSVDPDATPAGIGPGGRGRGRGRRPGAA